MIGPKERIACGTYSGLVRAVPPLAEGPIQG